MYGLITEYVCSMRPRSIRTSRLQVWVAGRRATVAAWLRPERDDRNGDVERTWREQLLRSAADGIAAGIQLRRDRELQHAVGQLGPARGDVGAGVGGAQVHVHGVLLRRPVAAQRDRRSGRHGFREREVVLEGLIGDGRRGPGSHHQHE
jgi:hypothetical protein